METWTGRGPSGREGRILRLTQPESSDPEKSEKPFAAIYATTATKLRSSAPEDKETQSELRSDDKPGGVPGRCPSVSMRDREAHVESPPLGPERFEPRKSKKETLEMERKTPGDDERTGRAKETQIRNTQLG